MEGDIETGNNECERQGIHFEPDNGRFRFYVRRIAEDPPLCCFCWEEKDVFFNVEIKEREKDRFICMLVEFRKKNYNYDPYFDFSLFTSS